MDSARKRKVADVSTSGSNSKRIKLLNSNHATPSTPTPSEPNVQQIGLKLVGMLRNAADKTGRPISDAFLTLPSRQELPDYYESIKLPVAIDTIEAKLKRNAYPTVTTVESDVKRMIQNAKDFNMPKSEIYEDAERMRKLAYNFMKVNNPAYRLDPTYSSFPTPIPVDGAKFNSDADLDARPKSASRARKPAASTPSAAPSERKVSVAANGADQEGEGEKEEGSELDFTGKSFQEAQEMIIQDLLTYTDADGLEIFTPFVNLPSRRLDDYYKLIRNPISLKGIQKRVRGQHGRDDPTGITDFKTWDAFEDASSWIWRNAREYNEDGSEMYELANELEETFKARLAEAKAKVDEPASMRIKLGASKPKSGITLNLGHRNSPGVSVDADALARQRQSVQTGVTAQQPGATGIASTGTQPAAADAMTNGVSLAPTSGAGFDRRATQSPARTGSAPAVQPNGNGVMQPPLARVPSGSPLPPQTNGIHSTHRVPAPLLLPPTPIRSYPLADALLPLVTISATPSATQHPSTTTSSTPFVVPIHPHPSLSVQNTTITLPHTHHSVQISPTIARDLALGRAYKIFVSINGAPLLQQGTQLHTDTGRRTHSYDGKLATGVNRIDVELAATKLDAANSKGLDVEKVTVFVNLSR